MARTALARLVLHVEWLPYRYEILIEFPCGSREGRSVLRAFSDLMHS